MTAYNLTVVSPGSRGASVSDCKKHVKQWLASHPSSANKNLNKKINNSDSFGAMAVEGLRRYQRAHGLHADGVCGPSSWLAMGFKYEDLLEYPGIKMRGIPWQAGVVCLDGNWINLTIARKCLGVRYNHRWSGALYSGWRPNWYQKILFANAVRKYGSESAASRWVARPGTSNHRFRTIQGAGDFTSASQLLAARVGFYQPMSWEPWHLQLTAGRGTVPVVPVRGFVDDNYEWEPTQDDLDEASDYIIHEIIPKLPEAA